MSGSSADTLSSRPSVDPPRHVRFLKLICRYLVAAAFLASSITKILDSTSFAGQIAQSGLPPALAQIVIAVLPWLELTCGFCLALGIAVREAAAIASVLLVVFLFYSGFHRADSDCGCLLFPQPLRPINRWPWLPLRNFVLLLAALWTARGAPAKPDTTSPPDRQS
jgi:uncharacterized membrane protein YphA (DoxX/SURF4 family)